MIKYDPLQMKTSMEGQMMMMMMMLTMTALVQVVAQVQVQEITRRKGRGAWVVEHLRRFQTEESKD
jgi:hypothetical protein